MVTFLHEWNILQRGRQRVYNQYNWYSNSSLISRHHFNTKKNLSAKNHIRTQPLIGMSQRADQVIFGTLLFEVRNKGRASYNAGTKRKTTRYDSLYNDCRDKKSRFILFFKKYFWRNLFILYWLIFIFLSLVRLPIAAPVLQCYHQCSLFLPLPQKTALPVPWAHRGEPPVCLLPGRSG